MSMPPLMPTLRCRAAATLAPNSWPKPAQQHWKRSQKVSLCTHNSHACRLLPVHLTPAQAWARTSKCSASAHQCFCTLKAGGINERTLVDAEHAAGHRDDGRDERYVDGASTNGEDVNGDTTDGRNVGEPAKVPA